MNRGSTRSKTFGQLAIAPVREEEERQEQAAYEAHMVRVGQALTGEAHEMWMERYALGTCRVCGKAVAAKKSARFCKDHVQYEGEA
jgi:hypothetical protein